MSLASRITEKLTRPRRRKVRALVVVPVVSLGPENPLEFIVNARAYEALQKRYVELQFKYATLAQQLNAQASRLAARLLRLVLRIQKIVMESRSLSEARKRVSELVEKEVKQLTSEAVE